MPQQQIAVGDRLLGHSVAHGYLSPCGRRELKQLQTACDFSERFTVFSESLAKFAYYVTSRRFYSLRDHFPHARRKVRFAPARPRAVIKNSQTAITCACSRRRASIIYARGAGEISIKSGYNSVVALLQIPLLQMTEGTMANNAGA